MFSKLDVHCGLKFFNDRLLLVLFDWSVPHLESCWMNGMHRQRFQSMLPPLMLARFFSIFILKHKIDFVSNNVELLIH